LFVASEPYKLVIFLDIDGVLNDAFTEDRTPDGFIGLNHTMIDNLKTIIDSTGASVVLTSTWKSEWDKKPDNRTVDGTYLHDTLLKHGVKISDKTVDRVSNRGFGIFTYLNEHPEIKQWVVLDDDIFFDYEEYGIMDHLVHTRFGFGGLTSELANLAISKLSE
jgi:hypothetical protein